MWNKVGNVGKIFFFQVEQCLTYFDVEFSVYPDSNYL